MPFIKIPGIAREIWFELHDPHGPETPLTASITQEVKLSPEQFATEMEDPNSKWKFTSPHLLATKPDAAQVVSARRFQMARTQIKRASTSNKGRPFSHFFSRAEDFAITALHFETLGFKQATRQAKNYWVKYGHHCPAQRHIEEALKVTRKWVIGDLDEAARSIRKKYRLLNAPLSKSTSRRKKMN